MVNAKSTAGKIEELESLRGMAAFLVVFFHMPKWDGWLDIGLINNAYLMVELFFVLSGFVIYNAYGCRLPDWRSLFRFQFRRFGRLYPVHLLFLLAFFAIECAKLLVGPGVAVSEAPFSANSLSAFVEQLFLVQAIGPTGNAYTFNSPAWSISVEFYTYLLFGLIVLLADRIKFLLFAALAIFAFVQLFVFDAPGFKLILNCITGFFLGCLLCEWLARTHFELPPIVLPLTFLALIVYLSLKLPQTHDWLIFVFSPLLILALLRCRENPVTRLMRSPVLTWLGSLSYAIYMSHSFLISMVIMVMKRGFGIAQPVAGSGAVSHSLPAWGAILAVAVSIAVVLAVSQIVFRFVEVPLRDRSRNVLR